ncbi:CotD family spore coat protein [Aquibacillus rhizosphaerae]|uniref:CotD family spore coat protein n=1 Tax=Aquibacillus rhizosphaerae TaxID=3051431 RepID=A0ABT7L613_9BACI|nr:CotD family spore coat protein [Aquibacillus sp. LR5S19]MDL4840844.1 CotD family spore coat protein [Aquibacillus sp. LR5S19]
MSHHKPFGMNCGCPPETLVYPTKYNQVDTCSENTVNHVHPSHTTVVNHHLTKNKHVYPHSTSYATDVNSVDVYGGSYQVPAPPRPNVPAQAPYGAPVPPAGPGMGAYPGVAPRPPAGPVPGAAPGPFGFRGRK